MSFVAVLGAGPIGAATAEGLARRGRVRDVRLIDAAADAAAGKALDIQQSGPVARFDTRVSAAASPLSAAGAAVVVVADAVGHGEWSGEAGLALLETIVRAGSEAPIVFAGPTQTTLMESCARTLHLPAHRLVGAGPSALVAAVRGLAGMEMGLSTVELTVVGRPPAFVIGWSAAAAAGALVTDRVPPHRLLAISGALPRLWPPGPFAVATATAAIVEALMFGSRRLHAALTVGSHGLGPDGSAVMLPLELGRLRILSHAMPSLSPQERTAAVNGAQGMGLRA
jgi:malate dehydrogenase